MLNCMHYALMKYHGVQAHYTVLVPYLYLCFWFCSHHNIADHPLWELHRNLSATETQVVTFIA